MKPPGAIPEVFLCIYGSAESYDSIRKWEYYVMLIKLFILFLYHTIYFSECWPQFMFKSKIQENE